MKVIIKKQENIKVNIVNQAQSVTVQLVNSRLTAILIDYEPIDFVEILTKTGVKDG